jgi:hypothetical protein
MRLPQLLIYEGDGRLAEMLREMAQGNRWAVRTPQTPAACLRLLRRGEPAVLVLKIGGDLTRRDMPLLERITWQYPQTATVVVSDLDNPVLAGLAWDLGARLVLFPPQSRDQLPEVVKGMMELVACHGAGTSSTG